MEHLATLLGKGGWNLAGGRMAMEQVMDPLGVWSAELIGKTLALSLADYRGGRSERSIELGEVSVFLSNEAEPLEISVMVQPAGGEDKPAVRPVTALRFVHAVRARQRREAIEAEQRREFHERFLAARDEKVAVFLNAENARLEGAIFQRMAFRGGTLVFIFDGGREVCIRPSSDDPCEAGLNLRIGGAGIDIETGDPLPD